LEKSFALLADENLLVTMRGQLKTDINLFLLVKFAEALSHLILGGDEKCRSIIAELLSKPATHKRPLIPELLLTLDVLILDTQSNITNLDLKKWLAKMDWAVKIRNRIRVISGKN
jgi:hypothetical protein